MAPTYFKIGSDLDADYRYIYDFIDGTLGDIVNDTNVPYVGLLQNETHVCSGQMPAYTPHMHYDSSQHYVFEPLEKKWDGTESTEDCAVIKIRPAVLAHDSAIDFHFPSCTIFNNLIFDIGSDLTSYSYGMVLVGYETQHAQYNNCLFDIKVKYVDSTHNNSVLLGCWVGYPWDTTQFFNCVFRTIELENTVDVSVVIGLLSYWNHCIIKSATIILNDDELTFMEYLSERGVYDCILDNSEFPFYLDLITPQFDYVLNNAFAVNNGVVGDLHSSNISGYDISNSLIDGTYYTSSYSDGYKKGIKPPIFDFEDGYDYGAGYKKFPDFKHNNITINDIKWPFVERDIGLLYYRPNLLHFTKNNSNLIFTTKE
jgi:hypothetical protein